MKRSTPVLAIVLAPIALIGLALLWKPAIVPLYVSVWHGNTAVQWRLRSGDPQTREKALQDAMSVRSPNEALFEKMVDIMRTDAVRQVRGAAAHTLGQIGHRQALPATAKQALSELILVGDDAMLSAVMNAAGASAAHNPYPDEVTRRIARVFNEQHFEGVYPAAAEALGQIGAAQPMPGEVFEAMNAVLQRPDKRGIRERLATACAQIATRQSLPVTTLDILADMLKNDSNDRIRIQAIYALAHAGADYPAAKVLITEATQNANKGVQEAAQHGLRIMEYKQSFAGRDPAALALDRSLPVETRLKALALLEVKGDYLRVREQILLLAADEDRQVAVAALGKLHQVAGSPDDDFDRRVLIPRLSAAMSHADPRLRRAAYEAFSRLSTSNPGYRRRAGDFHAQFEAGAADPDANIRVIALAALLAGAPGAEEEDAIRERALNDADPVVRRYAVSWLVGLNLKSDKRQALLDKAKQDSDASVREEAVAAQRKWESRPRSWPIELVQMWQAGEYAKLGMETLTYATIAAPVMIGGAFLVYYMARLLTYLYQRRWRAVAVVAVMAIWGLASYGMFMLYFVAGHASRLDTGGTLLLAGILWAVIAVYAALGWGMRYLIRR